MPKLSVPPVRRFSVLASARPVDPAQVDTVLADSPTGLLHGSACCRPLGVARRIVYGAGKQLRQFHRNQSGTISVLSVFGLMLLAMLLGMVINAGKQVDDKVRMQNAADAATYSGGVVIARGMNTLSFSNHLLCDVFALTAYMREARDQMAKKPVPDILAAWTKVGTLFAESGIPKFDALGRAIGQKVPLEQEMVNTFNEWASASSALMLPTLERILAEELIPEFQRAIVQTTPHMAQVAMDEVAQEHGARNATSPTARRPYRGVMWRTMVVPVDHPEGEGARRTLPVVDPILDEEPGQAEYRNRSSGQRKTVARLYLDDWNDETLRVFDTEAKMSQFANLWRGFTRGQLDRLLDEEYPNSNLLYMIREFEGPLPTNNVLQLDYSFVGVVYAPQVPQILPGLFRNPAQSDAQCFSQVMLFIPRPRLIKIYPPQEGDTVENYGGVPGDILQFDGRQFPQPPPNAEDLEWSVGRAGGSTSWNLLNQNWTVQLMPARAQRLPEILQTRPQVPGFPGDQIQPPRFPGITIDDIHRINTH